MARGTKRNIGGAAKRGGGRRAMGLVATVLACLLEPVLPVLALSLSLVAVQSPQTDAARQL